MHRFFRAPAPPLSVTQLLLGIALFLVLFDNIAFFRHVVEVYPLTLKHLGFLASLLVGVTAVNMLLLSLLASKYTIKPLAVLCLMGSALAAYFMDNYSVVVDQDMVLSILETNAAEVADLLSPKLAGYLLFLGLLPAIVVCRIGTMSMSWQGAAVVKLRDLGLCLLLILGLVLCFSRFYTSFFIEHQPLRYYANPAYSVYSVGTFLGGVLGSGPVAVAPLGMDARHVTTDQQNRKLVIFVVGEALRADRLSLNGYERETTPRLAGEEAISLTRAYSCGTSTAYSVPCMFSILTQEEFSDRKAAATENLLDVLTHAGVQVLWRDNNSDSKGVAVRVPYQDFSRPEFNPICDEECRDQGMLADLQGYIDGQQQGDLFIVLHQMGNHGPAYYKRYPPAFARFRPVCESNQFDECTMEGIGNAYDNAVLYTDFFLSKVVELLKHNATRFETAMFYMSDHGESLGEHGVYLHGLPYTLAPDVQKHVAAIFWFGEEGFKFDRQALRAKTALPFSHDNIFHTVLGLMEVETAVYDRELDFLADLKQ